MYDDARIMGIEIGGYNSTILVVNTYLPCSSDNNLDMFNMYLNKLDSIVLTSNTVYSIIMGDFNADIKADSEGHRRQLFGRKLVAFCESNNLVLSDSLRLANMDTYTFVSHAHGTTSWLDHAMSTSSMDDLIDDITIDYSMVSSDHFPMCVKLDFTRITVGMPNDSAKVTRRIVKWDKLSDEDILRYTCMTAQNLSNFNWNQELLQCDDTLCKSHEHIVAIDQMYESLISSLSSASDSFTNDGRKKYVSKQIPGWNEWVKEYHSQARDAFLMWRSKDSPRTGLMFDTMKRTRAAFKLALRTCRQQKDRCTSDALANKLMMKDSRDFWKEVSKMNNNKVQVQATMINGATGEKDIAEMWKQHYSSLLNSSTDTSAKQEVIDDLESLDIGRIIYLQQKMFRRQ